MNQAPRNDSESKADENISDRQLPSNERRAVKDTTGSNQSSKTGTNWPQRIETVCAILLVIITGTYTYYAGRQLAAMRDQLHVMEASNKPYTGVATISAAHNEKTQATAVLATIRNFGTTPAFSFSGTWSAYINGEAIPEFQEGQRQQAFTLFPGRSVGLQANFGKDRWDKIESGQDKLVLRARISYRVPEDGPLIEYCEQNQYSALGKAFSPERCPSP